MKSSLQIRANMSCGLLVFVALLIGAIFFDIFNVDTIQAESIKVDKGKIEDFIPNYVDNTAIDTGTFPSQIDTKIVNSANTTIGGVIVDDSLVKGKKSIAIKSFGASFGNSKLGVMRNGNGEMVYKPSNSSINATLVNNWVYMYAFIKIPESLKSSGGTITVTADTMAYFTDAKSKETYSYFSLATGSAFADDQGRAKSDTAKMKASDFMLNTGSGATTKTKVTDHTNKVKANTVTITIDKSRGDNYLRISYIVLLDINNSQKTTKNNFGQSIGNVQISYTEARLDPTITDVKGLDSLALENKDISFAINNLIDGDKVTYNNAEIIPINGRYSINVKKAGVHEINVTNGTVTTILKINVINIIKAGEGVTLSNLTANSFDIKIIVPENGKYQKIETPKINGATLSGYNYGIEACYRATFNDLSSDVSTTITATYTTPIKVKVIIDNIEAEYDFGATRRFKSDKIGEFVGWYSNGRLVSESREFDMFISSNMILESKTIVREKNDIIVTYESLAGKVIDKKAFKPQTNKNIIDIVREDKSVKAPVNPYMNFVKWNLVSDDNLGNVVVKAEYEVDDTKTFSVTIDGKESQHHFNEKIILKSDKAVTGWEVNDKVVTKNQVYELYVTSNMIINSITHDKSASDLCIFEDKCTKNGENISVVSAILGEEIKFVEVGFVIAKPTINDDVVRLDANIVMKVMVNNVTKTNQYMMALLTKNFQNAKVRMYVVLSTERIIYSNIINIS